MAVVRGYTFALAALTAALAVTPPPNAAFQLMYTDAGNCDPPDGQCPGEFLSMQLRVSYFTAAGQLLGTQNATDLFYGMGFVKGGVRGIYFDRVILAGGCCVMPRRAL